MEFSEEALIEIAWKASNVDERLRTQAFRDKANDDAVINSRIEKWCQHVAKGNWEQFEKRLAWDGLNLSTVRSLLDSVGIADEIHLPAWVETLKEAMQSAAFIAETLENDEVGKYRFLDPQKPLPFEEVFLPFVEVARQKLIVRSGLSHHLLSESAHADLERNLLRHLSKLGSRTLELKFSIVRTYQQPFLIHIVKPIQGSSKREQYKLFIKDMLQGKLLSFFREYSVLARLLAVATDLWVNATGEFIQRLASHWSEIQQTFQGRIQLGQVMTVESDISDSHNNGRSAIAVKFNSGLKLIYKPKNLGLEQDYFKLLAWFNDHGTPLLFKVLKVLNYSTHGWVEFVEHLPCQDEAKAKRYYQRAGMLLCVIYALKGTDCHAENIIACGEYPVLVDMETLMHPQVREGENLMQGAEAQVMVNQQLGNSVLGTGFLPRWEFGQDRQIAYDVSGLGGFGEQNIPFRLPKWKNVNTDSMALELEDGKLQPFANVPSLNGINLSPSNYIEQLVDGFQQMYQLLLEHRAALLVPGGLLTVLADQQVRFVFRNTNVYSFLLDKTLHPKFLRDGADRSIEMDVLSRALLIADSKPFFWPLLRVEQQALAQLDIPYFTARSNSRALTVAPHQSIENCFTESSYDLVISHLNKLSDEDMKQQVSLIRASLYSRVMDTPRSSSVSENIELNLAAIAPFTRQALMQQAIAIATELQQRAIRSEDGSAAWITLGYVPQAEKFQLQPMNYSLDEGACGVALFLAALERVTGGCGFHSLALGALQPLRQHLQNPKDSQRLVKEIGIGGAAGLGSIIYALVKISQFLSEPELLEDARKVACLLGAEHIAAGQQFDITSGAAGAILGLLALYNTSVESAFLEQAIACGQHLLNHRVLGDSGYRAWATLHERLLTGFSHGAAGIAYALLRLYEITQEPVFREAAEEAIAYERTVFSPQARNWPDFRPIGMRDGKPSFMTSWCHGASGIGLARLSSLAVLDTDEIRQEIEIALKTTQEYGLNGIDHLCCGNFGRIEVLLTAAYQLPKMELLETAHKQASWVIARSEQVGSFYLLPGFPRDVYIPSFFRGTAGIGYQLLRLAYPVLLPSVLRWQ